MRRARGSGWSSFVALMVMAGCSGCVEKVPTANSPGQSGASTGASSGATPTNTLKRAISLHGSSTVYPISQAMAEEYNQLHPDVEIGVGISGTGGGFKKFVVGEIDICNASRPITTEEVEKAKANKIEWIELQVAIDGLTVVVNPQNDFCTCLSVAQLKRLWEPDSQINTWKQLDPAWPDEKIELFGADTDSGTFDSFTESIVGKAKSSRADYTPSSNDNELVRGVEKSKFALGYFGYGYLDANRDRVKAVAIKVTDDAECVIPTPDTIVSGTYKPLSRPLFIYINRTAFKQPAVARFVEFYLTEAGQKAVGKRGFVELNAETKAAMKQRLEEALADLK